LAKCPNRIMVYQEPSLSPSSSAKISHITPLRFDGCSSDNWLP